jgi:hypothetical protein
MTMRRGWVAETRAARFEAFARVPYSKGPTIFWREENVERMLHLRAYFKAGRWDELMLRVFSATARDAGGRDLADAV